ncbi:MAG: amidohydrolase family protein [Anaerolineales bacterium]|nr:amidohydrolase family protein [Anaerolineales bacterium]
MQALATVPDLILHNGQIYTVDASMPWAEAIAIRKHRIVALGSNRDVLATAGSTTPCIDLGGRLVLPGFCDAHIHLLSYALGLHELRL